MKRRRVKITGIGPVTPAGIGKDAFWRGILEPVSRVRAFTKLDESLGPFVAAYIEDFDLARYVDCALLPKGSARHTLFAVAAAAFALKDAGLSNDEINRCSSLVVTGTSLMDFGGIVTGMDSVNRLGARGAKPRVLYNAGHGSVPAAISQILGIHARTVAISNQCCSGMDAIGYAASLIANGEIEIAVCGGTEAPLHRSPLLEFRAAGLTPATSEMPERLVRPFDLWRTTGVIGEGACMFVLEAEESPRSGYSYVAGYGSANDDAHSLCSGLVEAARIAVGGANLRFPDVEVINAWGPGHKQIDAAESQSIHRLFGSHLGKVPTVSIKAAIGTPLGATPAIQVASAALGQKHGVVPPTAGWKHADPECQLNLSDRARTLAHEITLVNAHGMGAVNSCLILKRC